MSKLTNEQLKEQGINRANRRIALGINKQNYGIVIQALHHSIPSWRANALKIMRGTNV